MFPESQMVLNQKLQGGIMAICELAIFIFGIPFTGTLTAPNEEELQLRIQTTLKTIGVSQDDYSVRPITL